MKIAEVKINGRENPLGFLMDGALRCAWKVTQTIAEKPRDAFVEVAADPAFRQVFCRCRGAALCSAGQPLSLDTKPRTRYFVRVGVTADTGEQAVSDTAWFETAKQEEPWQARWIATRPEDGVHPVFFRRFSAEKKAVRARLYLSGLGLFEARWNGARLGDEVLTPYYSNYHDEIQYLTYDVTEQVAAENELEVLLGNCWYKGRFGLSGKSENFGGRFQMIAELRIDWEDGTETVLGSDESWQYRGSYIKSSDLYDGEVQDRLLWQYAENPARAAVLTEAEGRLTARYSLPVREMEALPVRRVLHTPAGETVLDFGQNCAGYVAFHAALPRGACVTLDFGEILQEGNFCNANYRSAKAQFVYVSDGTEETVRPLFTSYGFRYVRVSGWQGALRAEDFTARVLYSDMKRTGWLETGHAGVNRLYANALWGQKSNAVDFPTDCPQRDERLGWTGDAQVFAGTASYNFDTAAFYDKFLHDLRTEQKKADGILPGVIPVFDPRAVIFSSVWGDIATFLPATLWEHYGDLAALRSYYPMMRDWVDKITREDKARGQRYLFDFGNQLGDWLALDGRTEQSMKGGTDDYFIGSCYYAESVRLTAEAARALGYADEETAWRALYEKIRGAIFQEYYSASGRLCIDTQTGYLVALRFGLYPDKQRVLEGLKSRLYKDCYKLKGGFVGAPMFCRVLAENGLIDEAFYFLLQHGYPGWMHCVDLGATTIWERWNSVLDNGLLSGTMMNSLNHYAFGAVVEYLYRDVAGLSALEPGFRRARIAPQLNQKLKYCRLRYDSAYGLYTVDWTIEQNGEASLRVTVPFGCSAVVVLPCCDAAPQEKQAGSYTFRYRPNIDLRQLYNKNTLFKEMVKNPRAMEIIDRVSPLLQHFLSTGNEEFLNESLLTLAGMSFLGFGEDEIETLGLELTGLVE